MPVNDEIVPACSFLIVIDIFNVIAAIFAVTRQSFVPQQKDHDFHKRHSMKFPRGNFNEIFCAFISP